MSEKQKHPTVLDIRQLFGDQYQYGRDEARTRDCHQYWDYIHCGNGRVYAESEFLLMAVVPSDRPQVVEKLIKVGCVDMPDGSDVCRMTFRPSQWLDVAAIIQPRRRPVTPHRPAPQPQPQPQPSKSPSLLSRLNPFSKS